MAEVEELQIGAEKLLRDLIVQRLMGVMALLKQPPDRNLDLLEIGACLERLERNGKRQECGEKNQRPTNWELHSGKNGFSNVAEFGCGAR
jgi:hypothetical protein